MDFFQAQDRARRNTRKLILLFALGVLSLIAVINGVVALLLAPTTDGVAEQGYDWNVFLMVAGVVVAIVAIGSLFGVLSLAGGGARVAEMMNGRLLVVGSDDPAERRALNVVEEMAIASGTPVPPLYLLEEAGINAFAAGYSPSDAVIGVTRGAIETLSRDELQGVIAHEFSHVLYGDMRLNIQLMGILVGLVLLATVGRLVFHAGAVSRRSNGAMAFMALGIMLVAAGYAGAFFGNLIQAAVSRQREFLADASAVQFTRNPDGIAGALMRIATHEQGSRLANPNSSRISHALFEEAEVSALSRLHATHPPLETRIAAILPGWDGSYELIESTDRQPEPAPAPEQRDSQAVASSVILAGLLTGAAMDLNQDGSPAQPHLHQASALLRRAPAHMLAAAREPGAARALIYSLVLHDEGACHRRQMELLEQDADAGVYQELQSLIAAGAVIEPELRLPLVEIALASLRQLSRKQYFRFRDNFKRLIAIDESIDLLEWTLQKTVFHHLDRVFGEGRATGAGGGSLRKHRQSCSVLLTMLAGAGRADGESSEPAFRQGAEKLGLEALPMATGVGFEQLERALDALATLKPLDRQTLMQALVACITADRKVTVNEVELLRAIAANIDCPLAVA